MSNFQTDNPGLNLSTFYNCSNMMKVVLTLLLVAYVSSASVESKKDPSKCSLKDESTIGVCLRKGEFTKTNLFDKTYYLCINISYPDLPCNLGK